MAKRMTKAESSAILVLIIIGIPIAIVMKLGESMGWIPLIAVVGIIAAICIAVSASNKKQRRESLMAKYGDQKVVDAIMQRSFWIGQSAIQLRDSLGKPHDIDQKLLKTKKKEVWKYNHISGNRYGLRITLDDDHVVGWDKKD